MAKTKGGPRRQPTPVIDMEHLVDILKEQVKKLGASSAFQVGVYLTMSKTQAINALGLLAQDNFILKLMDVNEVLVFNYKDLKAAFTEVCKAYPGVKESFPLEMRGGLAGKLAEATMTMCTHVRRLKDEQKFAEASRSLSDWQVQALERLRVNLPGQAGGSTQSSEKAKKAKTVTSESEGEEQLPSTQELLEKEMPATPGKASDGLLEDALGVSPVPARKQNLKMEIGFKKPAAAKVTKKPAGKASLVKPALDKRNLDYKGKSLRIMVYYKTTAVAVVAETVGQLFQVVSFKDARKLMQMLKNGASLDTVLAEKKKLVAWTLQFCTGWTAKGL